ncbi:glycosyltransferase family 39 protein [Clostridium pasteurianum]|uniref:PMT family glycosyltransferase, 4-amino-4-deoxy-L-arabinose transferase n=1 Tax=Clostridium pasteurianum BC1 TaxID=86416 RepID=R4KAR5_CLOPA|nr:glycosyltransferase family 39 protein [Clostridium pasteurianum]AGK96730.1 PMT family glycosyltransferase, 4-amino-4-deoxy-L-arabinose transferase [Clostridium pasteurianum BC1]
MKKIKFTKETIALIVIILISAILNFVNLGIEGYSNSYYTSAVKSMTMSLKNFFFVAFDPAGFVTIDKPPVGFWFQAISAKIFGFNGVSILLPSALASVISVILIYKIVKRAFGSIAGLISALFLAITPVFVAVSRNNTIDNILILFLLLACWMLSIAAEKGKFKYIILSMILVGVGFNVKMLQAYLVVPAIYITYLLATTISIKRRIINIVAGTVVLLAVSLSWAMVVDSVPTSSRPYIDSSTNNTVLELIIGHNGAERFSLSSSDNGNGGGGAPGGMPRQGQSDGGSQRGGFNGNFKDMPGNPPSGNGSSTSSSGQSDNSQTDTSQSQNEGNNGNFGGFNGGTGNGQNPGGFGGGPNGGEQGRGSSGGGSSQLQGAFGGETASGLTRLFSKNILSDQIVWFIPLAVIGFIAAAIREKLKFKLDNKRKQSLALWFLWFLPEFIYFSFNKGTFHSYYLTMLAPPIAALAGIGITSMWKLYKEGGRKAWFLPVALIVNGAVHLLMLYYFINSSNIIKILIILVSILSIIPAIILSMLNVLNKEKVNIEEREKNWSLNNRFNLKKTLVSLSIVGLLITPFVGSSAVLTTKLNGSFPAAGLELLSSNNQQGPGAGGFQGQGMTASNGDTKLIELLQKNKTAKQKYLLVVSNSNSAADIIINTGEPVMSLGGFLGNNKAITLEQFKKLVVNGEVRYVMVGGMGQGNGSSEIMNWVKQNGKLVSSSEYSDSSRAQTNADNNISSTTNSQASVDNTNTTENNEAAGNEESNAMDNRRGGNLSQQLYDLKSYTDSNN